MAKRIAVVGTGYVGLVTGMSLADFGNTVTCVDINKEKIDMLKAGQIPIYEPGLKEPLDKNVREGRLSFTTDIDNAIKNSEVVFIGVGTPPKENGEADLSYVETVVNSIAKNLNGYKVVVTKSTVPVGTNRWIKEAIAEKTNNKRNFDVVSNPEFLREGHAVHDVFHPDRVVIGHETEKAKEIMIDIYRALYLIETPFLFCNLETAELIKYASNAFLATKITFINQVANLCEAIGADAHKVAKGMGMDGRISPKFLHPGPGYGGSCFPKDTRALVEIAKKCGIDMSLVAEVVRANEDQKHRMVYKLEKKLKDFKGKRVGILGLAFKAETDDMRESSSIVVIQKLVERGASVIAHDPQAMNNAKEIFGDSIEYADNEYKVMNDADAIVILTEWNQYRSLDLEMATKLMKGRVILDTRNLLDIAKALSLGFDYEGVGR